MLFEFCHYQVCWLICKKERQYCSRAKEWRLTMRWALITISTILNQNNQLSGNQLPSNYFTLFESMLPSFYTYKLPISLYNTGILIIKYKVGEGKVSGSVVTCQYWIGRRLQILFLLYTVFLLAIRKYAVIRSPLVISDFLTLWAPYTMITPGATAESGAIHWKR